MPSPVSTCIKSFSSMLLFILISFRILPAYRTLSYFSSSPTFRRFLHFDHFIDISLIAFSSFTLSLILVQTDLLRPAHFVVEPIFPLGSLSKAPLKKSDSAIIFERHPYQHDDYSHCAYMQGQPHFQFFINEKNTIERDGTFYLLSISFLPLFSFCRGRNQL